MELTQSFKASVHDQVIELTRQVQALAQQLAGQTELEGYARLEPKARPEPGHARVSLPDATAIRQTIRSLQVRVRFFPEGLFADPAWNMLLDLAAAHREGKQVSVTSLCIASGVPSTTALRWINLMEAGGLICRSNDHKDRRRAYLALTDRAIEAMASYFREVEPR